MPSTKNTLALEALALFVGALLLFTVGLYHQEVIGFDSRFYLFDLEMWRYGWQWFPTTYQSPYPDYPVTGTFISILAAHLFGMNKLSAVFPSAVAAAIVVVMTYLTGALHQKNWGLCAVFFLGLTFTFIKDARSISLDMYTTMVTVCCFYLVYLADLRRKPSLLFWVFPLLVVGFVFRGPIGLVIPTGVICIYYLVHKKLTKAFLMGLLALLTLVACAGLLLLLAKHVGGQAFMQEVLYRQVLGRLHNNAHLPFYYYFINSFVAYALSYPMAWLVIISLVFTWRSNTPYFPEKKLIYCLIGWLFVILIGMSIPGDKKMRYILPIVPALALISAYPFVSARQMFIQLRSFALGFLLYLPALCILLVEAIHFYLKGHQIEIPIYFTSVILLLVLLQLLNFGLVFYDILASGGNAVFILFMAALSFIVVTIAVIEPIELHKERAREFIQAVERERIQQKALLVFYQLPPDGFPIKYVINTQTDQPPIFINSEQALLEFSQPAYFVTRVDRFATLSPDIQKRVRIVAYDKVGHIKLVVFTNIPAASGAPNQR